jgi:hypothetical protein
VEQVGPPLVAQPEAAAAQEPGERALHHPAVPSESLRGVKSPTGNPRHDAARSQRARRRGEESYALSACSLAGRLRGRPGFPRGPMIGGMASTSGSSWVASWALAAESRTASGMPLRSTTKWYFEPGLPRSVGFGPVASPPFWRGKAVHARPRPVEGRLVAQPVQQLRVQLLPDAGLLPIPQPPPAGNAAAIAKFFSTTATVSG